MTSLHLKREDIPDLSGKVAIITGGASGIGLAAGRILASSGAIVHSLDISPPHPEDGPNPSRWHWHICDVTSWKQLCAVFRKIGHVDIAIANAGVSEDGDFSAADIDEDSEPIYSAIDVNLRSVLNFTNLAMAAFKRQGPGGSIVITSSATAYCPEQSLPVYSATKAGLQGFVRALRSTIVQSHGATISSVAPAATLSRLIPSEFAKAIVAAGGPMSTADHVGLAIAYSATATQIRQVELYGRDPPEAVESCAGRWNGRTILTLGDTWTEVEEPLSRLRPTWLGQYQAEKTAWQQGITDLRPNFGALA